MAYNGRDFLPDCLGSLERTDGCHQQTSVFVLDNASSDTTSHYVAENHPRVHLVRSEINQGFAEGNNFLWRLAEQRLPALDYVFLLNQDTVADARAITSLVDYLNEHPQCGAAQSLLRLHPETSFINTAGNRLHYLGFGLPTRYREPLGNHLRSGLIDYPSGAAVMIRAELLRETGLFEPRLFMYLEDAELGWRLHLMNRPPHLCIASVIDHKYRFDTTLRSYEYLERNRWWLIATHYRLATLLILSPAISLMEVGQILYAIQNGLLAAKVRAVVGFLKWDFLWSIGQARQRIWQVRKGSDREILLRWSGTIVSPYLDGWMVTRVANPLLATWRRIALLLVWW